jgi:hypothetical protein
MTHFVDNLLGPILICFATNSLNVCYGLLSFSMNNRPFKSIEHLCLASSITHKQTGDITYADMLQTRILYYRCTLI